MSAAADKLARSRLAIIEHIQRRDPRDEKKEARRAREREQGEEGEEGWDQSDWFARVRQAVRTWWRSHPARLGLELAKPVLSGYAARNPAQFLGIAVAVGAIVIVARPWRLISLTGLIVALLKSSQFSSVVMSAMSAADFKKDHEPHRQ